MSLILNIESTTTACSVALANDDVVLAEEESNDGYSHAENLAVFVEKVLQRHSVTTGDLEAIAVSRGPGSYTGLRIGVSLAKGLCYGAGKPLIAVDTLQQMCGHPLVAEALKANETAWLCPMLDARRMEVYAAFYDEQFNERRGAEAVVLDEDSFAKELVERDVFFFGNGSDKFQSVVASGHAHFIRDVWPSAGQMAAFSALAFQQEQFVDTAYFEPFYLKEFQGTTPKNKVQ
ncbi:MAG: tRNA (adenosine(37)-N6)-threonylcarbamoyltransferase complex dimerization subunit type 1 TsaB [Cryomorphaceae bacterium]